MTASDFWTTRAKKAIESGYEPGNPWEDLLRRSVQRCRPKLVEELGDEFAAYLQVRTADAMRLYDRLIEQGTPEDVAHELAMADLLPVHLDDE